MPKIRGANPLLMRCASSGIAEWGDRSLREDTSASEDAAPQGGSPKTRNATAEHRKN